MDSRERVLAALNHQEPDHLPVDIGATPSSGISAIAYDNLKKHLRFGDQRNWVYDVVQQVTQPTEEFLDYFSIDVVDLGRTFNTKDSDWFDYKLANGSTAQQPGWFKPKKQANGSYLAYVNGEPIAKMPVGATFYDQTVFPFIDGYPDEYGHNMDEAMGKV
ncbi:MAG: methyltransferase, partial [Chloroflexota bacterium]